MAGKTTQKIALVTGASRGIGRAVALAMAKDGFHVVALARTRGGLENLDDDIRAATGKSATLVPLDLMKAEKVDAIGPSLHQRFGRLDAFIANAGVLGPITPLNHISDAQWSHVIELNLTANWRLIRTLDPLLRRAEAGRVVLMSSAAVDKCRAYWGAYSVSKAGLEALARTYAHEVENTPVRVNIVNPGPVATGMRARAFPGEDPATIPRPEDVAALLVRLAGADCTTNGERYDYVAGEPV